MAPVTGALPTRGPVWPNVAERAREGGGDRIGVGNVRDEHSDTHDVVHPPAELLDVLPDQGEATVGLCARVGRGRPVGFHSDRP